MADMCSGFSCRLGSSKPSAADNCATPQCLTRGRLAWSLTVHKVQGASIDYLDVDLKDCFEHGQAYVALSRARSASGLRVRNFEQRWVKTHEGAKRFHEVCSTHVCELERTVASSHSN